MRELTTKARADYDTLIEMVCTGQPFGGDKVCFAMPVTAYSTSCQQGRPPEFSIPAKTIVRIVIREVKLCAGQLERRTG